MFRSMKRGRKRGACSAFIVEKHAYQVAKIVKISAFQFSERECKQKIFLQIRLCLYQECTRPMSLPSWTVPTVIRQSQRDAFPSNVALADKVHLSPPRLSAPGGGRGAEMSTGVVALLNPRLLGRACW